jgi:hypothetical protein
MAPVNWNWHTVAKGCHCAAKAVGNYFHSLCIAMILPHDLEFTEHRFCDLIGKVSNLPSTSVSQYLCSRYACECRKESTHNLSTNLQHEVGLINQRQRTFICLDCLKTDGRSKEEGKCRISHS